MTFEVTVENKFTRGKRGIIVYNSSEQKDCIIPFKENGKNNSRKKFDLPTGSKGNNYLVISLTPRPVNLTTTCKIDLPSTVPFTFIPVGTQSIKITPSGKRTTLKIPGGPPTWQLKIDNPLKSMLTNRPMVEEGGGNNVTVGEDDPGGTD